MKAGWEVKRLGEVCELIARGVAPSYINDGGICVLNQKCVRDHKVNYELARRHDAATKRVGPERLVRAGDVLINSTGTGTLGRVAQVREEPPEPTTVDTHVTIVRPRIERFYPDFFGYMLVQIEDEIAASGEGASGQTELARNVIENRFQVSFPTSLPEQKRIVAILDEAFAGIATATANAEKNLANARELFEATLSNILTGNSERWSRYKLEEMVEANCALSYGIVQPGEEVPNGLPIVRPTDLTRQVIDLEGLKRIDPAVAQGYSRTKLLGGELLLCVRGSTGGISIASSELVGGNVTRGIVPIRFSPSVISQKLGYYLFLSKPVQDQIRAATYGTALMQINIRDLRQLVFIVPPSEDQPVLLSELESIAINTEHLKEIYEQKLTELANLKQAILRQAFSGDLTAASAASLQEEAA